MALMVHCPKCGTIYNRMEGLCPKCGYAAPKQEKNAPDTVRTAEAQTGQQSGQEISDVRKQRVQRFMMFNKQYLPKDYFKQENMESCLLRVSDNALDIVERTDLRNPMLMIVLSFFLGSLGIDRFIIGDAGVGIIKLALFVVGLLLVFTVPVVGMIPVVGVILLSLAWIVWFIDLFLISNATRNSNYRKVMQID